MSISDGGPGAAPPVEPNTEVPAAAKPAPDTKVPMVFTAAFWRYTVQVSRAGREDGDAIHVPGKLIAQVPGAGEKTWPAEVTIIKKDPKLRLDLRISPDRAGRKGRSPGPTAISAGPSIWPEATVDRVAGLPRARAPCKIPLIEGIRPAGDCNGD